MQISAVGSQVFKCNACNEKRMQELEQKRIANQWASEGCNGGLNSQDAHELELRREYQALQNKHAALQWASEGCNASICAQDAIRMAEIEAELQKIAPKTAPGEITDPMKFGAEVPEVKGNIYGVPESTFWGDWAR